MSGSNSNLTQQRLREVLNYDPETGIFTWRIGRRGRGCVVGKQVGSDNGEGYVRVAIDGERHKLHRLAFFYMTGEWPENEVDHVDGDKSNNRWKNLRDVTRTANQQNQRRAQRSNKSSGLLGVKRHSRTEKWAAYITTAGVRERIGIFDTPDEAHTAYVAAKRERHITCSI